MLDQHSSLSLSHHLWRRTPNPTLPLGGILNRLYNSLEIPSQPKNQLESALEHYHGNDLVHRENRRLQSQIITSYINQLDRIEINALRNFIYDGGMPTRVSSFFMNNLLLLLLDKLHHLVKGRKHNPIHMDERPS